MAKATSGGDARSIPDSEASDFQGFASLGDSRPTGGARQPNGRALKTSQRLVEAAYAIHQQDAWATRDVRFMGSLFIQGTLPHRDPGDVPKYSRVNGQHTLTIQPGPDTGIPYGSYPRLILAWLTTEVVRTRSREIDLGPSLSAFMQELGLIPSGGQWGTIGRFKDQVERLFYSRITAVYSGTGGKQFKSVEMATDVNLWWDPKNPDGTWDTSIIVGERLFRELTAHPVPIDMRVLREIKQSALALDLYMWATHRLDRIARSATPERPVVVSWKQLAAQFGTDARDPKHFAAEARKELAKIKVVWPQLSYETPRGRLVLHPGQPHVPGKSPS